MMAWGVVAAFAVLLGAWISQWPAWRYRGKNYVHDPGKSNHSRLSQSLEGVHWDKAKVPNRLHQCWVQTQYFSRSSHRMGRCACGGFTQDGGDTWTGRNFRRRV